GGGGGGAGPRMRGPTSAPAGIGEGLAAYMGFMGANRGGAGRERLPLVAALATGALILAQPLGMEIQRHITTSGEMRDMQIARIDPKAGGSSTHHLLATGG